MLPTMKSTKSLRLAIPALVLAATSALQAASGTWLTSSGILQDVSTQGSFAINGSSLTWTAVPEPSSALAGLLVGAGLLRRRRKA